MRFVGEIWLRCSRAGALPRSRGWPSSVACQGRSATGSACGCWRSPESGICPQRPSGTAWRRPARLRNVTGHWISSAPDPPLCAYTSLGHDQDAAVQIWPFCADGIAETRVFILGCRVAALGRPSRGSRRLGCSADIRPIGRSRALPLQRARPASAFEQDGQVLLLGPRWQLMPVKRASTRMAARRPITSSQLPGLRGRAGGRDRAIGDQDDCGRHRRDRSGQPRGLIIAHASTASRAISQTASPAATFSAFPPGQMVPGQCRSAI